MDASQAATSARSIRWGDDGVVGLHDRLGRTSDLDVGCGHRIAQSSVTEFGKPHRTGRGNHAEVAQIVDRLDRVCLVG